MLREGERILVNGENGNILVFDALSGEKLERIQTALDGSNIGALSDIINSASRAQLGQIIFNNTHHEQKDFFAIPCNGCNFCIDFLFGEVKAVI